MIDCLFATFFNGHFFTRFFKIFPQHGVDSNRLPQLPKDVADVKKIEWRYIKLFIVDEMSMVSSARLVQMHLRLMEVLNDDVDSNFAGKNIILLGDLLQLPPVRADFIFERFRGKTIGVVGDVNLWRDFDYNELTINMRQNEDKGAYFKL